MRDGLVPKLQTVAEMRAPLAKNHVPELNREEMQYRLAQADIAQADPRGSDVRLDTGEVADMRAWPRRPIDVTRWLWKKHWVTKWRFEEAIALLEVLAAQLALAWRINHRRELRRLFFTWWTTRQASAPLPKVARRREHCTAHFEEGRPCCWRHHCGARWVTWRPTRTQRMKLLEKNNASQGC